MQLRPDGTERRRAQRTAGGKRDRPSVEIDRPDAIVRRGATEKRETRRRRWSSPALNETRIFLQDVKRRHTQNRRNDRPAQNARGDGARNFERSMMKSLLEFGERDSPERTYMKYFTVVNSCSFCTEVAQ